MLVALFSAVAPRAVTVHLLSRLARNLRVSETQGSNKFNSATLEHSRGASSEGAESACNVFIAQSWTPAVVVRLGVPFHVAYACV